MTAQVIFFPIKFIQTTEKLIELYKTQEKLTLAHAELAFQMRAESRYNFVMAKMRYHNGFRDRWLVYKGFKNQLNDTKLLEFIK
jgi:hypothetical protein